MDALNRLWDSTDDLHRRFGLFPPDPEAVLRVFDEECAEFGEAAREALSPGDIHVQDACNEAADVIVTILATLSGLGVSREDFFVWCERVAAKNDAKNHETHTVNPATGKITRRSKMP